MGTTTLLRTRQRPRKAAQIETKRGRVCGRCLLPKEPSAFYEGNKAWCRDCHNAYYKDVRAERRRLGLCTDHGVPAENNGGRCARCREKDFRTGLAKKYSLTVEQYQALLVKQGGGCAICGRRSNRHSTAKGQERRLAVDHDHATGRVRGLLCGNCNTAIGKAEDSPERLRSMAAYLEARG